MRTLINVVVVLVLVSFGFVSFGCGDSDSPTAPSPSTTMAEAPSYVPVNAARTMPASFDARTLQPGTGDDNDGFNAYDFHASYDGSMLTLTLIEDQMTAMREASKPHRNRRITVGICPSEPHHRLQACGDPIWQGSMRLAGRLELEPIPLASCEGWIVVNAAEMSDDIYDGWRNAPCPAAGSMTGSDGSGDEWPDYPEPERKTETPKNGNGNGSGNGNGNGSGNGNGNGSGNGNGAEPERTTPRPRMIVSGPGGSMATIGHPRNSDFRVGGCARIEWLPPQEYRAFPVPNTPVLLTSHGVRFSARDCNPDVAFAYSSNGLETVSGRANILQLLNPAWRDRWTGAPGETAPGRRAGGLLLNSQRGNKVWSLRFFTRPDTPLTLLTCAYNASAYDDVLASEGVRIFRPVSWVGAATPCGRGIDDTVPGP